MIALSYDAQTVFCLNILLELMFLGRAIWRTDTIQLLE